LKGIVACLVLANIGFYLWQHDFDASAGSADADSGASAAAPETLQLAAVTPRAAGDAGTPAHDEAAVPSDAKRCQSVGPFRDVADAAHAATMLRGSGYEPRQRLQEGEMPTGVWVYLPMPQSRSVADEMMAKLKNAGVTDALEMAGPNNGAVISLGVYGDVKRAQFRIGQVQAAGFNAALADRKRSGNAYWVDVDLKPSDAALNPADYKSESGRVMRLEVKACPAVAAP
jgi:hypothetical protein